MAFFFDIFSIDNVVLSENGIDDSISTNGGSDTVYASTGDDYYNGGNGQDLLSAARLEGDVYLDLSALEADAATNLDVVANGTVYNSKAYNFEHYAGNQTTAYSDEVKGSADYNDIRTYGGNDRIFVSAGGDFYDAGTGTDTLDANAYGGNIDFNMQTGELTGAGVAKTAQNFENYEGNQSLDLNDVVRGSALNNIINTYGGDDRVIITAGINDLYDGGSGIDTLDASDYATGSLRVDLLTGDIRVDGAAMKRALNFENFIGQSATATTILGNGSSNNLSTFAGDDWLYGDDGDDVLSAGAGTNKVIGGEGQDRVLLDAGAQVIGLQQLQEPGYGSDQWLVVQGSDGQNTLVNADVETLQFSDGSRASWEAAKTAYLISQVLPVLPVLPPGLLPDLNGNTPAEPVLPEVVDPLLDPATGNPRLRDGLDLLGGKKADSLVGSALNDDLNGSAKNDTLFGGAGADHFHLATGGKQSLNGKSDFITDFSSAEGDKLVIHRGTFGAGSGALVICADNAQLNAALSTDASFAYNQASGQLFYNQNGSADGFGKPKLGGLMATITGAPDMITSDFIIL
jgi:Ca2+-binding RTX toxin-like protein